MKISPRLAFVATAVVAVALSSAAFAAPANKLTITDRAGDGNALNGQGFEDLGETPGAGSQPDKDIVSISYASTSKGKACTGFTASLTLGGPPTANTLYRLRGTGAVNTNLWWLQYDGKSTTMRWSSDSSEPLASGSGGLKFAAVVAGSTITFKVTEADLKSSGEKLASFTLNAPGADIRTVTPAVTAPQWDELPEDEAKSFKPC